MKKPRQDILPIYINENKKSLCGVKEGQFLSTDRGYL